MYPKGNQPWIIFRRTDAEAETPILSLATWCEELTHLKRPWCWERLKAGGEGDDRGWDGWMASSTPWTWVWVNSGSCWWTGRPSVLQSTGSQSRERLSNWTDVFIGSFSYKCISQIRDDLNMNNGSRGFPGGSMDRNPPASERDTGSILCAGRSHMPWSNWSWAPQLLKPEHPRVLAPPREKALQWEASKPICSNQDPVQPLVNMIHLLFF